MLSHEHMSTWLFDRSISLFARAFGVIGTRNSISSFLQESTCLGRRVDFFAHAEMSVCENSTEQHDGTFDSGVARTQMTVGLFAFNLHAHSKVAKRAPISACGISVKYGKQI